MSIPAVDGCLYVRAPSNDGVEVTLPRLLEARPEGRGVGSGRCVAVAALYGEVRLGAEVWIDCG